MPLSRCARDSAAMADVTRLPLCCHGVRLNSDSGGDDDSAFDSDEESTLQCTYRRKQSSSVITDRQFPLYGGDQGTDIYGRVKFRHGSAYSRRSLPGIVNKDMGFYSGKYHRSAIQAWSNINGSDTEGAIRSRHSVYNMKYIDNQNNVLADIIPKKTHEDRGEYKEIRFSSPIYTEIGCMEPSGLEYDKRTMDYRDERGDKPDLEYKRSIYYAELEKNQNKKKKDKDNDKDKDSERKRSSKDLARSKSSTKSLDKIEKSKSKRKSRKTLKSTTATASEIDTGLPSENDTGLPPEIDTGLPPDTDTGLPPDTNTGLSSEIETGLPPEIDTDQIENANDISRRKHSNPYNIKKASLQEFDTHRRYSIAKQNDDKTNKNEEYNISKQNDEKTNKNKGHNISKQNDGATNTNKGYNTSKQSNDESTFQSEVGTTLEKPVSMCRAAINCLIAMLVIFLAIMFFNLINFFLSSVQKGCYEPQGKPTPCPDRWFF